MVWLPAPDGVPETVAAFESEHPIPAPPPGTQMMMEGDGPVFAGEILQVEYAFEDGDGGTAVAVTTVLEISADPPRARR